MKEETDVIAYNLERERERERESSFIKVNHSYKLQSPHRFLKKKKKKLITIYKWPSRNKSAIGHHIQEGIKNKNKNLVEKTPD